LIILEIAHPRSLFSCFTFPTIAGMAGVYHQNYLFSVKMGSHKRFGPDWPQIVILSISAFQVARITVMSQWSLA
jgi:hypothetical protein